MWGGRLTFFAEGTFSSSPSETLAEGVADCVD